MEYVKPKAKMPPQPVGRAYTEAEKLEMRRYYEENLTVKVSKMEGQKCPRCYQYWGVEDNFMKVCDRCSEQLLDGADTLLEMGRITEEERDTIINGIKAAQLAQLAKYQRS